MDCASVLVAVSLGAEDRQTLQTALRFAPALGAQSLHVMHVMEERPDLEDLELEALERDLRLRLSELGPLTDSGLLVTTELSHGPVASTLLRAALELEADLVVLGRGPARVGLHLGAVLRKSPASVLVAGESGKGPILVGLDFSAGSMRAAETAALLARALQLDLDFVHVVAPPFGLSALHRSRAELEAKSKARAEANWAALLPRLPLEGVHAGFRVLFDESHPLGVPQAGRILGALAGATDSALVVAGSRGRTLGSASLLGGVPARLVDAVTTPMLVVKRKGETQSVLEALGL